MFFWLLSFFCWEFPVWICTKILIGLFGILMSSFLSSLYNLEIRPLLDVVLVKIFSHSVGCHFALFTMSFDLQKLLSFSQSHLLTVALNIYATDILFRKWSTVPTFYITFHFLFYQAHYNCIFCWSLWSFGVGFWA